MSENRLIIYVSQIIILLAIFSYFYIDRSIAIFFHNFDVLSNHVWFISIFHDITKLGESQYALLLLLSLFLIFRKKDPFISYQILYLFTAVAISGIFVDIVKIVFARYRPEMLFQHDLYGFVGFKMGALFNSLPSGHSATAFALAVGLTFIVPRYKNFYFSIAILVASSRVILTFHYLSDVLIGSLFGGIIAFILYKKYFDVIITSKVPKSMPVGSPL